MIAIFFRTLIIYLILMLSIRLMGKRQIGELQISEFIITLMLSEIAVAPICTRTIPILHAIIPILLLLSLEVIISFILLKNNKLKRIFYGTPSILIKRGRLMQDELGKNRVEIEELFSELRQKGFSDISDIEYAILEENGKLSVFPKCGKGSLTPDDMSLCPTEHGIAHLCVVDGSLVYENLKIAGWDEIRLFRELDKKKLRLEEVFLLTVDDAGDITVVKKEI